MRWTMDTKQDKELVMDIYENLYDKNQYFSFEDILKEYAGHPQWLHMNEDVEQKKVTYSGEA